MTDHLVAVPVKFHDIYRLDAKKQNIPWKTLFGVIEGLKEVEPAFYSKKFDLIFHLRITARGPSAARREAVKRVKPQLPLSQYGPTTVCRTWVNGQVLTEKADDGQRQRDEILDRSEVSEEVLAYLEAAIIRLESKYPEFFCSDWFDSRMSRRLGPVEIFWQCNPEGYQYVLLKCPGKQKPVSMRDIRTNFEPIFQELAAYAIEHDRNTFPDL
jgi:hypothetical protein